MKKEENNVENFKNYKEKQAYYRKKAKEKRVFWESREKKTIGMRTYLGPGRTYIKPIEEEDGGEEDVSK